MHVLRGGPAGGGYSTVEDLFRFAKALKEYKLLSRKYTETVLAGKVELPGSNHAKYAYGFQEEIINVSAASGTAAVFRASTLNSRYIRSLTTR
jgi:hypothetical protein